MRSYYEKHRDDKEQLLFARSSNHTFPPHFHLNLELFALAQGEYELLIGERRRRVVGGEIAVIDSYEVHAYEKMGGAERADDCVLQIPYRYLRRFNVARRNLKIAEPVVRDEALCAEILSLADQYLKKDTDERVKTAAIELILARLVERLQFEEVKSKDEGALIRQILTYIEENYRGEISRKTIARTLGYTEAHVSRVFHRYLGVGIAEYINGLRLAYVERLRAEGDERKTIELIYEAGFNSQQTYYRVKQARSV
ncbi:MAG: helix-turn-helix transcriptional regulator [Clostridia bacterium]|nr:helix-turn-helix transcriptional regulator [Clostridia bacterium]